MANKEEYLNIIVSKLTSARFLTTMIITSTLAYAVYASFELIKMDSFNPEAVTFRKEVFMYVMGVFSGIVGTVITSYFSRTDRKNGNSNLNK